MKQTFQRLLKPRLQAVGLEIGTDAIKAVELGPSGQGYALLRAGTVPTPSGAMQDGQIVNPQAIADALTTLWTDAGFRSRMVVAALGNNNVVTRNITVKPMKKAELDQAIRYEAEHHIPYPIDDVVLDYDVLHSPKDPAAEGATMNLLIAAAPKPATERLVEVLTLAGLEALVFDAKLLAALRTLELAGAPDHTSAIVLDIGSSSSAMLLCEGPRVTMTRNIAVTADDFTTALQRVYDGSFADAEALKRSVGRIDQDRIDATLRVPASELCNEVRRSVDYHLSQSGGDAVTHLFVSGGGAHLRGLNDTLGAAMALPVTTLDAWTLIGSAPPDDALAAMGPEFIVPLGLAMRGVNCDG